MLNKVHRIGACVIGVFLVGHLFNHLLALNGVAAHVRFMEAFRHAYRRPVVETARRAGTSLLLAGGVVAATLVTAAFAGVFYPILIPPDYLATYARQLTAR